ncbi:Na+/H+ antiporter NhaC [Cloacibacillus sp.]|uniref:Na+/H+ antiporter NhaC n=1 Tax=Cloacibacillus sp. TaxID=2049023 RepID=UPI0025C08901|nr:Na+/H+ antiporter NhaC [Cloacibacillus sp.]MCC8057307.1 Na+/H+ antiporter NhaC [Cloacibacillus sp.]
MTEANKSHPSNEKRRPTMFVALLPMIAMLFFVGVGFPILKLPIPIILLLPSVVAAIVAYYLGYTWSDLQKAISDKIGQSTGALLVLVSVGMLIGSWMISGTLPMMIYYGIQIIDTRVLYLTAFLATAIVSVLSGTSYGAVGTIGIVVMSIAATLQMSLPITAGAVVAGAYFGDKLSPLSDTTVLAAAITNTDIYEHIRHMLWTTVPASLLGMAVYLIAGFNGSQEAVSSELVSTMMTQFNQIYNWNILLLLPLVIVMVGSAMKYPTAPLMFVSSVVACLLAIFIQGFSFNDVCSACASGFNVNMVHKAGFDAVAASSAVVRLLNRGGMSSMMGILLITYCAFVFGGIVSCTGCLEVMLEKLQTKVKTDAGIISSTVAASLLMSIIGGVSYLSIIVTAELFGDVYKARGLASCNLSRTLEDSGTVVTALIPWTGGAAYMAATLGISTLDYLPWAIMNYTGFMFAIFYAVTGISIKKIRS